MDQNTFEALLRKAEENTLAPAEKLELMREINTRLERYNNVLAQGLASSAE